MSKRSRASRAGSDAEEDQPVAKRGKASNLDIKTMLESFEEEIRGQKAEIAKLDNQLKSKRGKLAKMEEESRAKLAEEREAFETEKRQVQRVRAAQDERLKFNVGGRIFTTTTTTLGAEPGSMLEAMFSGRWEHKKDEDGCVFLDRDGDLFAHVLAWLRNKRLPALVNDAAARDMLLSEAEYFGITSLVDALKAHAARCPRTLRLISRPAIGTRSPTIYVNGDEDDLKPILARIKPRLAPDDYFTNLYAQVNDQGDMDYEDMNLDTTRLAIGMGEWSLADVVNECLQEGWHVTHAELQLVWMEKMFDAEPQDGAA